MKLIICQFRKLFLLWTAFYYYTINQHHHHHSHYMAVAAIQTTTATINITNTTISMTQVKDNTTIEISHKAKQQQQSVVELKISAEQLINDTKKKEFLLMKIINSDLNELKEIQNLYAGNLHWLKIETTQTNNATDLMKVGKSLTDNSEVIVKNLTTLKENIKEKQYKQKTITQNVQQLLKLQNNTKISSGSAKTKAEITTTTTTSLLFKNATPSNQRITDSFTVEAALTTKPIIKIKLKPLTTTINDSKSLPLPIIYPTMQYPPLASNNGENNNNDNNSGSGDKGGGVDNGHLRYSRFAYFTTITTTTTTLQNNLHQHVGVLLPTAFPHGTLVQQGFYNFVEFFQMNLTNITVDFLSDDDATVGLSNFMKLLENSYYTMVVKILNSDFNAEIVQDVDDADNNERYNIYNNNNRNHDKDVEVDLRKGVLPSNKKNKKLYDQTYKQPKTSYKTFHEKLNSRRYRKQQQYTHIGYCNLEAELARDYNKTVLLWPCPHLKDPGNFLPSFEAISFAVKSIVNKLNWTQVDIYVGDENWALPMAIAANLQIPYTVVIGYDGNLSDVHLKDTVGNAIILTAPLNHRSTLLAFDKWQSLLHTKVLLIDIVAASFNANNHFYKCLSRLPHKSTIIPNLLLLTALSDNYRHYLNEATADDRDDIKLMQNFRQTKRQSMHHHTTHDWPIYLDTKALQRLTNYTQGTTDRVQSPIMETIPNSNRWWSECFFLMKNNTQQLCDNPKFIIESCWHQLRTLSYKQHISLSQLQDELHAWLQQPNNCQPLRHKLEKQRLVESLQEFIAFFNFFDFLIANIQSSLQQQPTELTKAVPSYDFIVFDIIFNNSEDEGFSKTSIPAYKRNLFKWRPLLILEQHEINLNTYISHSIQPGFDEWLLVTSAQLWHCSSICWLIIAICGSILLIIVAVSIAVGIALRNYFLRKRLSKGPNKIVLSASDFVFPVDSRRVDEGIEAMLCCWLQQLQEFGGPEVDKPDLLKGSIRSLKNLGFIIPGINSTTATGAEIGSKKQVGVNKLARHNPALLDMRARYNGDLVQLKDISLNSSGEVKSKAMDLLIVAHGLRHENINPFLGWLADASRTAMVFDYCSRGSLQDILIMDEIKLDWSFRLSLLTDLVRGMRYLHNSPLRVHGTLTSRNCVVDARWVLKITDYGLPLFYEAQGITAPQRTAKELLWTAPELLRTMKIQQILTGTHNPTQQQAYYSLHHYNKLMATQSGDVYSFGIIMQEVVVRGEPYCMLSLSAEEIIMKIKKPPPLIRPSVSKGAAPPEAINIMRQCWAEQPDMRPDFNSVYERFKLLNHGRKVNFVDTMFQMLEKYSNNLEELIRERTEQLDIERKKTEQLLNRMLPSSVAEKLKMGLAVEPEEFSDVTIYFSDIVGFTTIAAHCTPVQVVDLLNDLYTIFDATINAYNVYKVETIGDAYMVVSGLPVRIPDHAEQIATMALDLLHQSGRFHVKHLPGVPVQLRIGLHTGPCCAGVVGLTMPRYCLFGDTVNTASRMESTGSSWRIHLSQETRNRLDARGGYVIEPRGPIDIKGKGMMNTFWLLGKTDFDKPLPNPPPIGESHGLDELFIRNSITIKSQANRSRNSTNPSSSQSSSLAGEALEVKVEVTPPTTNAEIPNSYSLDNNSISTISPNVNLCAADFPSKTPSSASPQSQKMSDNITSATLAENLLNPTANFARLPNSTGGSSTRLYRKVEEMMDLSSPYNHYKCLSPSESNLTQFYDGKYIYSKGSVRIRTGNILSSTPVTGLVHGLNRFEKPGSTRLLRRQYSLDRDDPHRMRRELNYQQHHVQMQHQHLKTSHTVGLSSKSFMLEVPLLQESARTPKIAIAKIHKQNSTSIAQDLEKIEEIPLSPVSSIQQYNSLDSSINKSPPPTMDTVAPMYQPKKQSQPAGTMILLSAPTSPAPSQLLNSFDYKAGVTESPLTDTSTATTTVASVCSIQTASVQDEHYDNQIDLTKTELTLNVGRLLSR